MALNINRISASGNDGDQTPSGNLNTTDSIVFMGRNYTGGFRFVNLNIPVNSTVLSASIRVFSKYRSYSSDPIKLKVKAVDEDDTAIWSSGDGPRDRVHTTAGVDWDIAWKRKEFATSPDIKDVVQEVVSRGGWALGNALAIVIEDDSGFDYAEVSAYDGDHERAAELSVTYVFDSGGGSPPVIKTTDRALKKTFSIQFWDADGTYKTTLNQNDFSQLPKYTMNINAGLSDMSMQTAYGLRDYKDAGKRLYEVEIGDTIKMFIHDSQSTAKQVYSGIFIGYELTFNEGKEELLRFNFLPNLFKLGRKILRDSSNNTTVSYSSLDPATIMKNIISSADAGIRYDDSTVFDAGVSRTYEFVANYTSNALDKIIELSPKDYFYFVGGDDLFYYKSTRDTEIHKLFYKTHVSGARFTKDMTQLRNKVVFLGGGSPQLFKEYNSTASQSVYGIIEERISDERVLSSATAQIMANRILANQSVPRTIVNLDVIDNNTIEGKGYDIERFKIGDKVILYTDYNDSVYNEWGDFTWGVDFWKYDVEAVSGVEYIIKKIHYNFDSCELELDFSPIEITQRIEDINRNLTDFRFKDAPAVVT